MENIVRVTIEDFCTSCPHMELEVNSTMMYADGPYMNNHNIACKNIERCRILMSFLKGDSEQKGWSVNYLNGGKSQ